MILDIKARYEEYKLNTMQSMDRRNKYSMVVRCFKRDARIYLVGLNNQNNSFRVHLVLTAIGISLSVSLWKGNTIDIPPALICGR